MREFGFKFERGRIYATVPVPPSANMYWRKRMIVSRGTSRSITYVSNEGIAYRKLICQLFMVSRIPGFKNLVEFEGVFFPPDRRRRDNDNLRKCLFDSLTHAGVWPDDSNVTYDPITKADPCKNDGHMKIRLTPTTKLKEVPLWAMQ